MKGFAPYVPRGGWGALVDLDREELRNLAANSAAGQEGKPWKPDLVKLLPLFPHGQRVRVPFFRPTIHAPRQPANGRPRPFMRAGSPIDRQSGVYLLWDDRERVMYIGSSVGTSRQGNIRRTLARHWQSWNRLKPLSQYVTKLRGKGATIKTTGIPEYVGYGGVSLPRQDVYVCIFLIDNDSRNVPRLFEGSGYNVYAPRQVEAWYYEHICSQVSCVGQNQIVAVAHDEPDRQFETVPF